MRRQDPWPAEFYTGTCSQGHPRSPENTRVRRQNDCIKRTCRICLNQRKAQTPRQPRDARAEYLRSSRYRRRVAEGKAIPDEVELRRYGLSLDILLRRDEAPDRSPGPRRRQFA